MTEKSFKQYRARIAKEGILKALLCGLIVAFSALFVSACVFWFIGFKHVWVCAIVFVGVAAIATPLFYHFEFRPTVKQVAMRIDELGLEERVLTMMELKGDDSFIAQKQKEDTEKALASVNASLIAIAISVPLIVAVAISGVLGAGMTTIAGLVAGGYIKSGSELIEEALTPDPQQYEVTYEVMGEGMVEGDMFQVVLEGKDASAVTAVADDEWAFMGWSDGVKSPLRVDKRVDKDITVVAIFMELEAGDAEMEGTEGEEGEKGKPSEDKDGKPSDKPGEGEPSNSPSGSGKYEPSNQVIDGETYYGDEVYDSYYEAIMEYLAQNEDIPAELKQFIADYFDAIEQ